MSHSAFGLFILPLCTHLHLSITAQIHQASTACLSGPHECIFLLLRAMPLDDKVFPQSQSRKDFCQDFMSHICCDKNLIFALFLVFPDWTNWGSCIFVTVFHVASIASLHSQEFYRTQITYLSLLFWDLQNWNQIFMKTEHKNASGKQHMLHIASLISVVTQGYQQVDRAA